MLDGRFSGPAQRSYGESWSRNWGNSHSLRARIEHQLSDTLTLRQIVSRQWGDSGREVADFTGISTNGSRLLRRGVRQAQTVSATTSQTEALWQFKMAGMAHLVLAGFEYVQADRSTNEQRATLASISIAEPVQGALPGTFAPASSIDVKSRYAAPYIQDQIALTERIDLLIGVRRDDVEQRTTTNRVQVQEEAGSASPRIGAVWRPSEPVALYANVSTSFRSRPASVFGGGLAPPERGRQYEVGSKVSAFGGRVLLTAAAFQITKQNIANEDPQNSGYVIVTGQQRVRGLEMDVSGDITAQWRVLMGAGYLDASITRDTANAGNRMRGVPRFSANIWSTYRLQQGALSGLTLGAGLIHVGEREGDLANSYRIDGYTRVDLTAAYPLSDTVKLALMVRNVADTFYIEQPVARTTNYPGAPRSVSLSLTADF